MHGTVGKHLFNHRDCSYGGELVQLGGLAHVDEISPSLRNSYKIKMFLYEKLASPPMWDFI